VCKLLLRIVPVHPRHTSSGLFIVVGRAIVLVKLERRIRARLAGVDGMTKRIGNVDDRGASNGLQRKFFGIKSGILLHFEDREQNDGGEKTVPSRIERISCYCVQLLRRIRNYLNYI